MMSCVGITVVLAFKCLAYKYRRKHCKDERL